MADATLARPVSVQEASHVLLAGAVGATIGISARWLDMLQEPAHSVGGVLHLLFGLVGTWVVVASVLARRSPTLSGALAQVAVFMSALAVGRFFFGARLYGQSDYGLLTPWLLLGLVALPTVAGLLWWTAHRAWRRHVAVQVAAGAVLALPVAVLVREAWWAYVLRGDDAVAFGLLLAMTAVLVAATTRTLAVALGLLLAVVPAYLLLDGVWPAYTQALTALLSPGAPYA